MKINGSETGHFLPPEASAANGGNDFAASSKKNKTFVKIIMPIILKSKLCYKKNV